MPTSRLYLPPMTQDLWPVLRDRVKTAAMTAILKGANRVYIRGELKVLGTGADATVVEAELYKEDVETKAWGKGMIIPVLPLTGLTWTPGDTTKLEWLWRTDFNDLKAIGYPLDREVDLAQREAARQWEGWEPNVATLQIITLGAVWMVEGWQSQLMRDQEAIAGTVYKSSRWAVEVASASD